ncbi:MAG: GDP-L-fucose synthase family protein [Candidatus Neomarinimicrobiota bacterium]
MNMLNKKNYWEDKRIAVTGGKGFLGSVVVEMLKEKNCNYISVIDHNDYDLTNIIDIRRMYKKEKPDIVIHLAAVVGGIGANRMNPGSFFYDNAMMGIQLLHEGYISSIKKFVAVGTICAYPKFTPVPFKEENLWDGYPEETNAPYGIAKKIMLVQSKAYREQYNFNSIFLLPVNLYGPGDNFNPNSSHVIPALIKKCVDAKFQGIEKIVVWGTGKPTREFLHVKDAAKGIILATEKYNSSDPVNLGAGFEISIMDLLTKIVNLTGFKGEVFWDGSKPDGQPRRMLDTNKARKKFGFEAQTLFNDGLKETIESFLVKYEK